MPPKKRIVIDASVARSAGDGSPSAELNYAAACRDHLTAVREHGHIFLASKQLFEEWKLHRSTFSRTWLTKMYASRLVEICDNSKYQTKHRTLSQALTNTRDSPGYEDIHLIAAALLGDKAVVSRDAVARQYFCTHASSIGELASVCWINPETDSTGIDWITDGVPFRSSLAIGTAS